MYTTRFLHCSSKYWEEVEPCAQDKKGVRSWTNNCPGISILALTPKLCKQAWGKSLGIEDKAVLTIHAPSTGFVRSTRDWGREDTLQVPVGLQAASPTSSASSNRAPTEQMPQSGGRPARNLFCLRVSSYLYETAYVASDLAETRNACCTQYRLSFFCLLLQYS